MLQAPKAQVKAGWVAPPVPKMTQAQAQAQAELEFPRIKAMTATQPAVERQSVRFLPATSRACYSSGSIACYSSGLLREK